MKVQHNMAALNAGRQLGRTVKQNKAFSEKLSSGYRVNRAADDASGLAISEKMRAQIRGLNKGSYNCTNGISLLQTADGALEEVHSILHRLKELTVQSANDTNTDADRKAIQYEVDCLLDEIDKIGNDTEFNTRKIFKGGEVGLLDANGDPITIDRIPFTDINLENIDLESGPFNQFDAGQQLHLTASLNEDNYTTVDGFSTQWNLIYGNGSTSYSNFRVTLTDDDGNVTDTYQSELRNMGITPGSFDYDDATHTFSRTFRYEPIEGEVCFDIVQSVRVVSPENADYKYYELSYTTKNTGNKAGTIDFMFHADTAYNNNDRCEGYFTNGNRVENMCVYTTNPDYLNNGGPYVYDLNTADISNGMSIVDVDSALPFAEKMSWGAASAGGPDTVSFGYYYSIWEWKYYDSLQTNLGANARGQDLGFSLIWSDTVLNQGESRTYSFRYGIVGVDNDPNLDGVPINKNTQSSVHTDHLDLWIQSGANSFGGCYITIGEMNTNVLAIRPLSVTTHSASTNSNGQVSLALDKISLQRAQIGAYHNRLEYAKSVDDGTAENLQASESAIRDMDMADGMMGYARTNILMQAGQSMLAQANQSTQGIMQLLQ